MHAVVHPVAFFPISIIQPPLCKPFLRAKDTIGILFTYFPASSRVSGKHFWFRDTNLMKPIAIAHVFGDKTSK